MLSRPPPAVVVDVEGTYITELPDGTWQVDLSVDGIVRALWLSGNRVVFVSERPEHDCKEIQWILAENFAVSPDLKPFHPGMDGAEPIEHELYMLGDTEDVMTRIRTLFDELCVRYTIMCVLDDEESSARIWRDLGVRALHVV